MSYLEMAFKKRVLDELGVADDRLIIYDWGCYVNVHCYNRYVCTVYFSDSSCDSVWAISRDCVQLVRRSGDWVGERVVVDVPYSDPFFMERLLGAIDGLVTELMVG